MIVHGRALTAAEMRDCDGRTISGGTPGSVLMERAGYGVLSSLRRHYRPLRGRRIWIVCGKGNNGGDGLVVARLLHDEGRHPRVFLAARPEELGGDAALQLEPLRRRGITLELLDAASASSLRHFASLGPRDIILDGLFGTGLRGPLAGFAAEIVGAMNASRATRVAIDIPSGLSADSGDVDGPAVRADRTVTMGALKRSFLFYPARAHVGVVDIVDIGIPPDVIAAVNPRLRIVGEEMVRAEIHPFPRSAHKGTRGKVLIAGGSPGLTGAVCLAATAAAHSGAGLVRAVVPRGLNAILEVKLTEPMTYPADETDAGTLAAGAAEFLLGLENAWDALALGPGMGRHPESDGIVTDIWRRWRKPLVVDADGLNALAAGSTIAGRPRAFAMAILTPHLGEMARLAGRSVDAVRADPVAAASRLAQDLGCVVLLKGAPTVVADPNEPVLVNVNGNPGLATGGSGDVLTGMIVALLGSGLAPAAAAATAAWLHAASADHLAASLGERGVSPSLLATGLGALWKKLGNY